MAGKKVFFLHAGRFSVLFESYTIKLFIYGVLLLLSSICPHLIAYL